jgi:hypothetical protein
MRTASAFSILLLAAAFAMPSSAYLDFSAGTGQPACTKKTTPTSCPRVNFANPCTSDHDVCGGGAAFLTCTDGAGAQALNCDGIGLCNNANHATTTGGCGG